LIISLIQKLSFEQINFSS